MMKFFILSLVFVSFCACSMQKKIITKEAEIQRLHADSIDGVYIPKDIEDCCLQLDTFFADSVKNNIRKQTQEDFLGNSHFGLGMWIRNNWGLWGGSRLANYFHQRDVYHPDSMSGLILTSYYRYLKGEPINFEEQISQEKYSVLINTVPDKKDYPKAVSKGLEFNVRMLYQKNENDDSKGVLHIGKNLKKNEYWLYDYTKGWKKVDLELVQKLENSDIGTRYNIIKEIFEDSDNK